MFLLYPRLLHCYFISDVHNNRHIIEFSHTASGKFCPNRQKVDGEMVPAWQQAVLPCRTCSPSSCKLDTFWETKAFFILAWMAWSVLRSSQSLSAWKDQQQRVNDDAHVPVHTASTANELKSVTGQQISFVWKEVLADTRLHVCRWRGAQDGGEVRVENRSQLIKEIHLYFFLSQLGAHGTGQLLLVLHCSVPQDTGEPLRRQASPPPSHTNDPGAKYDWTLEDTHHLKASWRFEATLPTSSWPWKWWFPCDPACCSRCRVLLWEESGVSGGQQRDRLSRLLWIPGLQTQNGVCTLHLSPVTRHMPRRGSPTASGRIQSRLCMPQRLKGADSSVLKIENKLWQVDLDWIFGRISSKHMGDTYSGHILLWCSVPREPRRMSRKARTVCHDEECRLHCRWQSVLLNHL